MMQKNAGTARQMDFQNNQQGETEEVMGDVKANGRGMCGAVFRMDGRRSPHLKSLQMRMHGSLCDSVKAVVCNNGSPR
ncbi:hypothetical protein B9Z55_028561 [Caenorhabditis nigoni]|uniref:Uncharacterized protein n=1 Tax=Caenorhabditis nigoni TaxID=1611254 RepID=A0A2G5SBD4_9PELO|nr:hypothetical protein B9Z55_028561 [Caenorhabditis nigoni]